MSLRNTMALDYRQSDDSETVTYTAPRASGTTIYTVNFAEGRDVTLREVRASEGIFAAGDRAWVLGAAEFPVGFQPQRGDTVAQASGAAWMVKEGSALDELGIAWDVPTAPAR